MDTIWDLGFGVWHLAFGILESGIWNLGFGIWDLGFGIWDLGFGIWDLGSGTWVFWSLLSCARAGSFGSGSQKVQHFGEIKQKRATISRQPLVYTRKTQRI